MSITTREMEVALYKFYKSSSLLVVPRVTKNNCFFNSVAGEYERIVNHECDLLVVSNSEYLTEVEIKISISDLKADFKKGHSHKDENIRNFYYAIPSELKEKAIPLIPDSAGILIVHKRNSGRFSVDKYRRCKTNKKADKTKDIVLLKLGRLSNLRYWNTRIKMDVLNED